MSCVPWSQFINLPRQCSGTKPPHIKPPVSKMALDTVYVVYTVSQSPFSSPRILIIYYRQLKYISFCLLLDFRLANTKCMVVVDMWKRLTHSNLIQLREVFTTKAFGDHCLYSLIASVIVRTYFVSHQSHHFFFFFQPWFSYTIIIPRQKHY